MILVHFDSGHDLLAAFWGILTHGGLILDNRHGVTRDQDVLLEITLGSDDTAHRLVGTVVKEEGAVVYVAFHEGQPVDVLLSTAWAAVDGRPPRRHARLNTDEEVSVQPLADPFTVRRARLWDVSSDGMCLRVASDSPLRVRSGDRLLIGHHGSLDVGVVRWSRPGEVGVQLAAHGG